VNEDFRPGKCRICGKKAKRPRVGRPRATCGSEFCLKRHSRVVRGLSCAFCHCPLLFREEQVSAACSQCRKLGELARRVALTATGRA